MYWTKDGIGGTGGIFKADMDGSNVVEIHSGLSWASGIAIDFESLRLFWTDWDRDQVRTSNLDGTDAQPFVQLERDQIPWGIAITSDRVFWGKGFADSESLQSSDKTGQDIKTLYNGTHAIRALTVATPNPAQARPNHCEGQTCSAGICVLSRDSFRCVA